MRSTARWAVVGAAAVVALAAGGVAVASGLPVAYGEGSAPPCADAAADAGVRAPFDLMFATHMIPHHESAVAMAEVALDRSQREEVRTLSETIIATQSAEISLLREAADRLGAPSVDGWGRRRGPGPMDPTDEGLRTGRRGAGPGAGPGAGDHGMRGTGTDLETLAAVPPDRFDRAFLEAMIEHHRSGVHMAQMEALRGSDAEVVALAEGMVTVQSAEIRLMQTWLEEGLGT